MRKDFEGSILSYYSGNSRAKRGKTTRMPVRMSGTPADRKITHSDKMLKNYSNTNAFGVFYLKWQVNKKFFHP
jgi:hypothetical protein